MNDAQRHLIQSIIDQADDITIATNREDGYPQATTVSYVNDGLSIYFGTWVKSQKAVNLLRDARMSATINLPYATWSEIKGLSIGGRARKVEAPAELEKAMGLMLAKFPQVQQYAADMQGAEMAFFRIEPEVISILDYSKSFGHTELVRV
ncbi:MAG: pyridoxamine 5'-phosphate oxidase family protein [Hyphomonadaceae bacterium]|nr:pyridoxamine 5'-phosphate oxidase family protein [Hyphomonadaceae bacterium]